VPIKGVMLITSRGDVLSEQQQQQQNQKAAAA
jgi:hypothetical protein